ncbi:methyl-accepting chemotaxis protein [Marinobacter alexandrii]|uniref:methyl-accepting chemotaxis protein n=2 Tax=Marinobacter alexandrii TaxID=2570351 RepID=UPI002ABE411C|nr:methyl-accepting chemotaxis protein [Marinobacter alexandrii]
MQVLIALMQNFLSNTSVKFKLLLAFGFIILLIAGTALSSYSAFQDLFDRNDKVRTVSKINNRIDEARFNEKNFFLRGQPRYVDGTNQAIDEASAIAKAAQARLESPEQKTAMASIQKDLAEYRDAFQRMVAQKADSEAALDSMEVRAREAVDGFVQLEQFFQSRSQQQLRAGQELEARETQLMVRRSGELAREMLDARRIEKNYVLSESPQDSAALTERLSAIKEGTAELADYAVTSSAQSRIAKLEAALGSYETTLFALTRSVESMTQDEAHVTELARNAREQAEAALASERSLMTKTRDSALLILIGATVVAVVVGTGSALLITRSIVRPLEQLVAHASKIADGDLSQDISTNRKDDLGRLMMAMQVMTENLRHMVKEVSDGISQIASSAEELSAVTEQTRAGATQQRDQTDQVATAMNEMTATIQEVAQNAEAAAHSASDSDARAKEGYRVVSTAMSKVETLSQDINGTAGQISKLRDDSADIGSILDVIRDIAEQTNLLALNAAIEAARAGEQGRGFAVVADEVRALARRTHDSTGEIETLVKNLQQGAYEAVESMHGNSESAESSVHTSRTAGEALSSIADSAATIQSMNQQIATAVEEQTSVAEDISENIVSIREVTEQNATANNQIAISSNDLAQLGSDLKRVSGRFKV